MVTRSSSRRTGTKLGTLAHTCPMEWATTDELAQPLNYVERVMGIDPT